MTDQGVIVYNEEGQVLVLANIADPLTVGMILVQANRQGHTIRITPSFTRAAGIVQGGKRLQFAPDAERQAFMEQVSQPV